MEAKMADNRMLLIHLPSGDFVRLARQVGGEWKTYKNIKTELNKFLDICGSDDFALGLEDNTCGSPYIFTNWKYIPEERGVNPQLELFCKEQ